MVQHIDPTKILVVPRDGALEITLNINITVDGQVNASSDEGEVQILKANSIKEKKPEPFVPEFTSSFKLPGFGKKE